MTKTILAFLTALILLIVQLLAMREKPAPAPPAAPSAADHTYRKEAYTIRETVHDSCGTPRTVTRTAYRWVKVEPSGCP